VLLNLGSADKRNISGPNRVRIAFENEPDLDHDIAELRRFGMNVHANVELIATFPCS